MKRLAPIVLFLYNRPDHSRATLDALALNPEAKDSELFIYCDGAKTTVKTTDIEKIAAVRSLAHRENRFAAVKVIEQPQNKGLATSILDGVTEIVNVYSKVIVLEDDLQVAPYFLSFMNEALSRYEQEEEVACISGYVYPVKQELPETFFIKVAECWGWATWKRAWQLMETNGKMLLQQIEDKQLQPEFDFENSYPYTQMLSDQVQKKNNSWAILWYASVFLKNKLCLFPGRSLVQNTGNDGSGTHSQDSGQWQVKLTERKIQVEAIRVEQNRHARQLINRYFRSLTGSETSYGRSLWRKIRRMINKNGSK